MLFENFAVFPENISVEFFCTCMCECVCVFFLLAIALNHLHFQISCSDYFRSSTGAICVHKNNTFVHKNWKHMRNNIFCLGSKATTVLLWTLWLWMWKNLITVEVAISAHAISNKWLVYELVTNKTGTQLLRNTQKTREEMQYEQSWTNRTKFLWRVKKRDK